jgi:hypothetical protein
MAKGIIPILHVKTPPIIGLDIEDIMEAQGVKHDDEFTYTTRYTADEPQANCIRAMLHRKVADKELDSREVEAFLKLMDQTAWDCSFLVDTF